MKFPTNKDSFWSTTLDKEIAVSADPSGGQTAPPDAAKNLVDAVKELYKYWNINNCKGQCLTDVGLKDEPYFKYFSYPDFLTPQSGLIQIRKYAEQEQPVDLLGIFSQISKATKIVKAELYRLLEDGFKYFE